MAIEKTVKINVDTSQAVKGVDNLTDSVKDLDKKADEVGKKGLTGLGKASNVARKGVKSLAGGFKILGGAIKAAGIGLLITAFLSLKEVLTENERTAKFFKVAFEGVSIVMNDFINFVLDNSGAVVGFFKDIFENPLENIKALGETIQDNIVERFVSFLEVLGFVGEAMKKFVTGDFKGALESVKEAGKELVDVATGVDNTFDKVVDGVGNTIDAISEYGDKVIDTAKKNTQLAESAQIAAAQQALLVERYDRQAEKLRQIRDNDLKGIDERIKANNDLKSVLDEQEKAMLREADAILASAAAQASKNNNTENASALIEAQANREGVLAQIEGFRSEQESNRIALIKERLDLEQSASESEAERNQRQKQFEAEREENELLRLEKLREILEEERIIEEERLQLKIDSYTTGTQARLDAENELKDRLQEIDQEITTNADEQGKAREEISKKESEAKKATLNQTGEVLEKFGKIAGEQTAAGKTLAVASATINTFRGVSDALAAKTVTPFETALKFANAAAIGVSGIANVKDILKVKVPSGGGGGSAPSSSISTGGGQQAPAFNLVGQSGVNQVQDSLQEESTPLQAYVVGSQITNQQELDRNQQDSASIG